jgi:hypothetical protein
VNEHPSSQFLPAGEIDNRIGASARTLSAELHGAMKQIEDKLDSLAERLTLLIGTPQTKGVLSRIEEKVDRAAENQEEIIGKNTLLVVEVAELRKKVEAVEKRMALIEIVFTITRTVIAWSGKVAKATGDSPIMLKVILGLVLWMFSVQGLHTVWPMIRESLKHHHLMF